MSEPTTVTPDAIEALAAKLDAIGGLDADERLLLAGVFALAGQATAGQVDVAGSDVAGFAQFSANPSNAILIGLLLPAVQKACDGSVRGSFSWGLSAHGAGGGGGAGKAHFQDLH